jgi:hypothetical protein
MAGMSLVIGIDPGPTTSAIVVYDPVAHVVRSAMAEVRNADALTWIDAHAGGLPVAIERVESMGMAVGAEVFETVWWSGRFFEATITAGGLPYRLTRHAVKLHLTGTRRAKEAELNTALRDRFGGSAAKGTKARPGPCFGVTSHAWAALAVALTFAEEEGTSRPIVPPPGE